MKNVFRLIKQFRDIMLIKLKKYENSLLNLSLFFCRSYPISLLNILLSQHRVMFIPAGYLIFLNF